MIGERLKMYRTRLGMNQDVLSEMMGFAPNIISKIETGYRKVSLEEAVRLVEILGITLNQLVGMPETSTQACAYEIRTLARQCAQHVSEATKALETASALAGQIDRSASLL